MECARPPAGLCGAPLWVGLVGLAAGRIGRWLPRIRPALPAATIVTMLALCVWSLMAIHNASIPWDLIGHL